MIILREKSFARKDYEGLSKNQHELLKNQRDKLAKQLNEDRKSVHEMYNTSEKVIRNKGMEKPKEEAALDLMKRGRKKMLSSKVGEAETYASDARNTIKNIMSEDEVRSALGKDTKNNPKPKPQTKEVTEGFLKRNWNKLGTGGKVAAIGVPVAAAALGTGLAIKKHNDKKKSQEKSFSKIKHTIEHGEDSGGKYTITKYRDPETGELREEKNYIPKKPSKIY